MTDHEPGDAPRTAGALRPSSLLLMVALVDLVVILPYSYWRFSSDRQEMIVVCAIEGVGVLSLLCVALYLRRRGT
jgi:hypothetical protein